MLGAGTTFVRLFILPTRRNTLPASVSLKQSW